MDITRLSLKLMFIKCDNTLIDNAQITLKVLRQLQDGIAERQEFQVSSIQFLQAFSNQVEYDFLVLLRLNVLLCLLKTRHWSG